jgi:outer membrane protein assembly factor BamB
MGSTRYEMRAVELVEVEVARNPAPSYAGPGTVAPGSGGPQTAGRAPDDDPSAAGSAGPRRTRPRRALLAATVGVLAVGVGANALVAGHQERERLAALADVPGVLQPLDGPLGPRWRSDVPMWVDLHAVAGLLIGVTDTRDGSRDTDVVAIDAATGETVWTAPATRSDRAPLRGVLCVVPDAAPGADDADRVVACLVVDELGPSPHDLSRFEPVSSRLLVLAVTTGEVVEERVVDPTTSLAAIGPDLVVMDRGADDEIRVVRTDPLGTQERWRFEGPPGERRVEYAAVRVDDGLVVVPGESGWVLSGEGEVVRSWTRERPAPAAWAEVLAGRTLVRPLRDVVGATSVTDLETGAEFTVDGYPLTDAVDDGSAEDVILMQSSAGKGVEAYERSGEHRWTAQGPDSGGMVVLDGRVIRVGSEVMGAVDVATGRTVWETEVPVAGQYGLVTDGRLVLRAEPADDDVVVTARGVDDGRVRWQGDLPDDVQHLFVVAGRLYGYTPDGLVALGPDGVDAPAERPADGPVEDAV